MDSRKSIRKTEQEYTLSFVFSLCIVPWSAMALLTSLDIIENSGALNESAQVEYVKD